MGIDKTPQSGPQENGQRLPAQPQATESFKAELAKRKEALLEKLKTFRSEKVSMGSNGLESQGVTEMEHLIQEQIAEINKLEQESAKAFATRIRNINTGLRDEVADEVLKEFNQDGRAKVDEFLRIADRKTEGGLVSPWDVDEIEKALQASKEIDQAQPEMRETYKTVLNKVRDNHELKDDDYEAIIGLLNPVGLSKSQPDVKAGFESTIAGSILSFMRPDQRYSLVEHFMNTPDKKAGTSDLIEAFLSMGLLTRYQTEVNPNEPEESLLEQALAKKIITQAEYDNRFKPKFENNQYQKDAAVIRERIKEEVKKKYGGRFDHNIVHDLAGKPMIGAIVGLWGLVLTTFNLVANIPNMKEGNWGAIAKNPYIYAGIAGMAAGTEIFTGTLQDNSQWFGNGLLSKTATEFGQKESTAESDKRIAKERLTKYFTQGNNNFREYLTNGGFGTLHYIRQQKEKAEKEGKGLAFTLKELIAYEDKKGSQIRAEKLRNIQALPLNTQTDILGDFLAVTEIATHLDLTYGDDGKYMAGFEPILHDIRMAQNPTIHYSPQLSPSHRTPPQQK